MASGEEKLTEQLSFRVSPALYQLISSIAKRERRKPNEVARALLERGAAAYGRDRELFEPIEGAETSEGAEVEIAPSPWAGDALRQHVEAAKREATTGDEDRRIGDSPAKPAVAKGNRRRRPIATVADTHEQHMPREAGEQSEDATPGSTKTLNGNGK